MSGGAGNDVLNGGDGSDTADFRDASAKTKIDLSAGTADVLRSNGSETDTLASIENVIANANSGSHRHRARGHCRRNAICI